MESRGTTQNCREPHKMAWNHAKPHRTTYELSTVGVRCLQIFFFLQINIVFCLYQFRVLDKHHTHKCMCVCMCARARAYTHTHTHTVHTHNHTPQTTTTHKQKQKMETIQNPNNYINNKTKQKHTMIHEFKGAITSYTLTC